MAWPLRRARGLARLVRRRMPDVPMNVVTQLAHRALIANGAENWTSQLGGHLVQRYAMRGTGSGPAVLLLHGLNATSGSMAPLVSALRTGSPRIALLDLPSHGRSPDPAGPALSLPDYGKVALQAAEELHQETGRKVLLVGNSLGGALAFYVAQERPALVAGVVGLNPAGAPVTESAVASLPRLFHDVQHGAEQMAELLFARVPLGYWLVGRDVARGWASKPVQKLLDDARAGTLADQAGPMLRRVQAPTLILWGAEDKLLPYVSAEELRTHLPQVRVEILPGVGHVPQLERPAWTAKRVRAFLDELAARGLG